MNPVGRPAEGVESRSPDLPPTATPAYAVKSLCTRIGNSVTSKKTLYHRKPRGPSLTCSNSGKMRVKQNWKAVSKK